jgi:hypothetical protein
MTELKLDFVGHYRNHKRNIMIDVYERHISEDGINRENEESLTSCPLCRGLYTRKGVITHLMYAEYKRGPRLGHFIGYNERAKRRGHGYTYERIEKEFPELFRYFNNCSTDEEIRDRTRVKKWAYTVHIMRLGSQTQYEFIVDDLDTIEAIKSCSTIKDVFELVDPTKEGLYAAKEELEKGVDDTMKDYLRVQKE